MLLQVGRQNEIDDLKRLFGEERFDKIKKYYQTNNREFFKTIDSQHKFFGSIAMFPYKSFAYVYLRPVDFLDRTKQALMKAKSISTKGIIFNQTSIDKDMEKLIFDFSRIKKANAEHDKIKEINDKLEADWKEKKKEVKAINKAAREKNKELEKEWKKEKKRIKKEFEEVLEGMSDEQKKFMPDEPEYPEEPKYIKLETEPPEPGYRHLPRSQSIHLGENRLYKTYSAAWQILSTFDMYMIEGTSHGVLVKKEEPLKYTYENLGKLRLDQTMTRDEFLKLFDKTEKNEKILETYRPSILGNYDFLDLLAENNSTFKGDDWLYSEDYGEDEREEMLPSLAQIKPMHAASILSAGMKFSKEIKTDEGFLLIKSAPVKVFTEKEKIINGKKITEIYQQNETKLAFYNLDTRTLEVY